MVVFSVVRDQCSVVCLVHDLHDCDRGLQWMLKGVVAKCIVNVFGLEVIVCHHRVGQLCVILRG